jgi:D-glycero-D-manno-heptose 1,7-bisphosphate phosphatase
MKKLVIFDRDETLISDLGYTHELQDLAWKPGSLEALQLLNQKSIRTAVATNQSGIGRGFFTFREVDLFHEQMNDQIKARGGGNIRFFVCPHIPEDNCNCRKPKPELLFSAIHHFGFSKEESVFLGNSNSDRMAAMAAGIDFLTVNANHSIFDVVKVAIEC